MYSPYGEVAVLHGVRDSSGTDTSADEWSERTSNTFENALLYCGYYRDSETGLYHVRHRCLHATLGRWTSRDPIGYADGMSLYEYVRSAPAQYADSRGLGLFDGLSQEEQIGLRLGTWRGGHEGERARKQAEKLRRALKVAKSTSPPLIDDIKDLIPAKQGAVSVPAVEILLVQAGPAKVALYTEVGGEVVKRCCSEDVGKPKKEQRTGLMFWVRCPQG